MTGRDPGAQPERTRFAWRRTVLAGTVAALLAVRLAVTSGPDGWRVAVIGAIGLGWLVFLIGAQRRITRLAAARPAAMTAPWPLLLSAGTLGFIVASGLLLL